MMTIKINNQNRVKKMMVGACSFLLPLSSFLFASCSDWDDHYEDPVTQSSSTLTLWQTIQQYPELNDFSEVLGKTMFLKQHKKTAVSYADQLNGSQTFTVLAPVNGSFDKASLLAQLETDSGDSAVIRSFVGNHLSYGMVSSTATPSDCYLLNTKRVAIGAGNVLGSPIQKENLRAKGGILHILERPVPYRYNIYEALLNDNRYTALGQLMNSYEDDEFNPTLSIPGEMVDGEQIYIDSVFDQHNIMLDRVGKIADEDSTFIMLVPSATEWDRVWQEALKYYHYAPAVLGADSLQRFWSAYSLLNDAIFSRKIQISATDSLITYDYNKKYPKYHVFHKPFEEGGILYGATPVEYSNGTLYTTDQWPLSPETTFQREIKIEAENESNILSKGVNCDNKKEMVNADSVSENGYMSIKPLQVANNWDITYELKDVLSGTYDICVIVLPLTVADVKARTQPTKFKATLSYIDAKGNSKTLKCVTKENSKDFLNDSVCVDTVMLAENFTFPTCNYDQRNTKFSLKLETSVTNNDIIELGNRYTRQMLLDCIYLRPKKRVEE